MAAWIGENEIVTRGIAGPTAYQFPYLKRNIIAYWGGEKKEVSFPIDSRILKIMKSLSPTRHVGVRIENFEDPRLVSASWVIWDANNKPADELQANVYYAILDDKAYVKVQSAEYPIVCARFGRHGQGGEFFVFFNIAKLEYKAGGTAGEPEGSGAVVR